MARLLWRKARGRALSAEPGGDALDRLDTVGARAESGDTEVALAARSETGPGHAHHLSLGEQPVEEIPRRCAGRRADPDVGGVAPAVHREAGRLQALTKDAGVVHVLVDQRANLFLSLRGVHGGRGTLHDV